MINFNDLPVITHNENLSIYDHTTNLLKHYKVDVQVDSITRIVTQQEPARKYYLGIQFKGKITWNDKECTVYRTVQAEDYWYNSSWSLSLTDQHEMAPKHVFAETVNPLWIEMLSLRQLELAVMGKYHPARIILAKEFGNGIK